MKAKCHLRASVFWRAFRQGGGSISRRRIRGLASNVRHCVGLLALAAATLIRVDATPSLGLQEDIVTERAEPGSLPLVRDKHDAALPVSFFGPPARALNESIP